VFNVKICDFGTAKFQTHDVTLPSGANLVITPIYCPPELVDQYEKNETTDVYSFGCLMLHLLTSKKPWNGLTPQAAVECIKSSNLTVMKHYLQQD
jgi:serine/threonine protein kinase